MRTHLFRRAAAAGASAALAVTGLAAFAPAANAESESVDFVCTVPILGAQPFTVTADTDLPDTIEVGKKVDYTFTANVSVPDNIRSTALALFGDSVEGHADIQATAGEQSVDLTAAVPTTVIPTETGPLVLDVAGAGSWTPDAVGTQEVRVSGFDAVLVFIKDGVKSDNPLTVPCVAPEAGPVLVDTVDVTEATTPAKVGSTTKIKKAKFAKKKKRINVTAQVRTADKKAAKGKVKVTLKKGKKTVKVIKGKKLNKKGIAKVKFNKIAKKGKYKVIVQYQGNKQTKKSKKNAVVRVK